jgi:hypothetical protein
MQKNPRKSRRVLPRLIRNGKLVEVLNSRLPMNCTNGWEGCEGEDGYEVRFFLTYERLEELFHDSRPAPGWTEGEIREARWRLLYPVYGVLRKRGLLYVEEPFDLPVLDAVESVALRKGVFWDDEYLDDLWDVLAGLSPSERETLVCVLIRPHPDYPRYIQARLDVCWDDCEPVTHWTGDFPEDVPQARLIAVVCHQLGRVGLA